jgi:signal transduction histidine kinase
MRFWKKRNEPAGGKGLQQSALQGASHEELIEEAVAALVRSGDADRFGVWLEAPLLDNASRESLFRGMVWDGENDSTPREWRTLAPQSILPLARLLSGTPIEITSIEEASDPLVGPLVGLRAALWVPVQHAGKLRGILMAGTNAPQRVLPKERMQSVAVELALALALETERRVASERHTDIVLCKRILTGLQEQSQPEALLQEILESCLAQAGRPHNPGALFAVVAQGGELSEDPEGLRPTLEIVNEAGASSVRQILRLEPVNALWRQAVQSGRTMGNEVRMPSSGAEALRVIAVPLSGHIEGGTLFAGFRPAHASLASLERLEFRGTLAAAVLSAKWRREASVRKAKREKAILEANLNPVVLIGPQGAISESNRAARALLLSLPPALGEELALADSPLPAGKLFHEFFRVRDREKIVSWQRRQKINAATGESPEVELDCGARVKLRSHEAGEPFESITLLPVNVSHTSEESRSQAELLSLAEWLDQGVILFDGHEQVRLMNLRFAQLAGLAPEEVEKYRTLDSLIERLRDQSADPQLFTQHWKELARHSEGGEREEIHLVRPAARVLERASRPILDVEGKKLGRLELYRDLTAQRVFQAKLLQTERMAALGQMVSGVAHELSNPLTSIFGYAQRLLLRGDTDANIEEIRKIFGEAERAGAILRRMLLAARETAPDRRVVSLNQIVQRTIELQRFSLAAERIRVDLSLASGLPNVLGDSGQLQQVLINLMGNARQAIEAQGHGGTIRVRTGRTKDNRVLLEVSDSGPGIPEGIMARIFDPFFTTKPAGVGTGLGLSIVLSLVREHGGQVHVYSPRGSGAVFLVELPPAEQKEVPDQIAQRSVVAGNVLQHEMVSAGTARKASGTQRVLVVEDEPTVAQLISDVLRDEGFEVEVLLDGRNAGQRIARERFDLIICDMKMPNLDGQSLYESLTAEKKSLQKKFLFVTGDVLGAKTHDFLKKNRLPHVAKPFRVEELLEKVHQVLQPVGASSSRQVTPLRKNSATTG